MSEILLCNQPLGGQALQNQCGISIDQLSALSCNISTSAAANTPYLIGDDHSVTGRGILGQLAPSHVAKELTNLSLSFGGDNVVALAEIKAKLQEYNIGLIVGGVAVAGAAAAASLGMNSLIKNNARDDVCDVVMKKLAP